jgi:hypothetical protein
MNQERATEIAVKLKRLHVSDSIVIELLSNFDLDAIESQIDWLPFRKAKRPGAFLIQAIRNNYSPPKEEYHAHAQTQSKRHGRSLDKGLKPPV